MSWRIPAWSDTGRDDLEQVGNQHNANLAKVSAGGLPDVKTAITDLGAKNDIRTLYGKMPFFDALFWNTDHFRDGDAFAVWEIGHQAAMAMSSRAREAAEANNAAEAAKLLKTALAMSAQANHYGSKFRLPHASIFSFQSRHSC